MVSPDQQKGKPKKKVVPIDVNVLKGVRVFELIVTVLIVGMVLYVMFLKDPELSYFVSILILGISGFAAIAVGLLLLPQFDGGDPLNATLLLVAMAGTVTYAALSGILAIAFTQTSAWYVENLLVFSVLASFFFAMDAFMSFTQRKRRKQVVDVAPPREILGTKVLYERGDQCHPLCVEKDRCDLTTSVSSIRLAPMPEEELPDHSIRKVAVGRRREYVDHPTSPRSTTEIETTESIQTEKSVTLTVESQTPLSEITETPVQTVSRCEMCQRQIDLNTPSTLIKQADCSPCPAVVQLIRGTPCCAGCKCVTLSVKQQSQQKQTQDGSQIQQTTSPVPKDPSKLTEMPETITKLTLASYSMTPSETTETSMQTATDDGEAARNKLKEKSPEPEVVEKEKEEETKEEKEEGEKKEEEKEEVTKTVEEMPIVEEPEEPLEQTTEIEAKPQSLLQSPTLESITEETSPKFDAFTQSSEILESTPPETEKETDVPPKEEVETTQPTKKETEGTEAQTPDVQQDAKVETAIVKALSVTSNVSTGSCLQYYNIHRDKRGRLFCDICASLSSAKVLHKLDPNDAKGLKCTTCGHLLRLRCTPVATFSPRSKSDNCPKCEQPKLYGSQRPRKSKDV